MDNLQKSDFTLNQLVRTDSVSWTPLDEPGVSGVYVKVLRFDPSSSRATTILLKFDAGASYPAHSHPGGEELFVLEGDIRLGKDTLQAGDYLFTHPGNSHGVHTTGGCIVLLVVPEEVVKLKPPV